MDGTGEAQVRISSVLSLPWAMQTSSQTNSSAAESSVVTERWLPVLQQARPVTARDNLLSARTLPPPQLRAARGACPREHSPRDRRSSPSSAARRWAWGWNTRWAGGCGGTPCLRPPPLQDRHRHRGHRWTSRSPMDTAVTDRHRGHRHTPQSLTDTAVTSRRVGQHSQPGTYTISGTTETPHPWERGHGATRLRA